MKDVIKKIEHHTRDTITSCSDVDKNCSQSDVNDNFLKESRTCSKKTSLRYFQNDTDNHYKKKGKYVEDEYTTTESRMVFVMIT